MFVEFRSPEYWNRYSLVVDPSGRDGDAGRSDEEFRRALVAGDFRAAVASLMRRHGTGVYRFCLHLLGDRATAEDVLQLVFVQAFEALPSYEARASALAWLLGIARHRCMDTLKGQRHRLRVVSSDASLPEVPDPAEGGDASVSQRERQKALRECLEELSSAVRELVYLRFSAELSYDEIAELSGEQAGTLRVRVSRALPVLRECLERKGMAA